MQVSRACCLMAMSQPNFCPNGFCWYGTSRCGCRHVSPFCASRQQLIKAILSWCLLWMSNKTIQPWRYCARAAPFTARPAQQVSPVAAG